MKRPGDCGPAPIVLRCQTCRTGFTSRYAAKLHLQLGDCKPPPAQPQRNP